MSALTVSVTISGVGEVDRVLHALRNSLASREPMHSKMAKDGQRYTQTHLRELNRHQSAARLGATATGHHIKSAARVESSSDGEEAAITIPRNTGLGRAFGDVVIRPGSGRTYLTRPAHVETYGKTVKDFPADTFRVVVIQSWRTFVALAFRETGGRHTKGEVGFWLTREVKQKQDRTLLPSDEAYAKVARGSAVEFLTDTIKNA